MVALFILLSFVLIYQYVFGGLKFSFEYVHCAEQQKNKYKTFKYYFLAFAPAIAAVAGGVAKGALSKQGASSAAGSSGGGGLGGIIQGATDAGNKPIKATVGLATGAIQALQAHSLKKQADAAMPPLVDAGQAAYLAELNQKRRSIETGADFAAANQAADEGQAATNDAITRNGAGDSGETMQALLQAQRNAGDIKNQAIVQGQGQQQNYDSMYGGLLGQIAGRKMQLQLLASQQKRAEWDRKSKLASANLQGGLANLLPGKNNMGQNAPAQLGGGDSGNGLNVMDMIQKTPSMNNSMANVPSAPSAAPTVTPNPNTLNNFGTPITLK